MSKIFITAHLPDALIQPWLQHVRDFDQQHPDCHFEIAADCPDLSLAQMVEALRISPELTFNEIIRLKWRSYNAG